MAEFGLTCTKCGNTFDFTVEEGVYSGADCPKCLEHNEMLPPEVKKEITGKLILGVPVFEDSNWAESVQCDVTAVHDSHVWDDDSESQRYICRGKMLDTQERVLHVLLTQQGDQLKVAGISRQPAPLFNTFEQWHNKGRVLWLLTLTDPQEGLPGVKLESITPTHQFLGTFVSSDSVDGRDWDSLGIGDIE